MENSGENMNNSKYTILFGGGAIRGLAYVGALRAMEELGIEYDIIGGSSVGALFAALVACGYKSYELENLFMKVNFELFKDIHFGFGKGFALSRGELYTDWVNELISKKLGGDKLCFKDLKNTLVVITTNLTEFKTQEFSALMTPDFEIAKAIRVSSSMPGLMPPYDYNGSDLVDGDLQKASPMWKLSETLNNSPNRILEFRLEGDCQNDTKNPLSFINTIYSCVTEVATNFVMEIYGQNDRYDCVSINTGDIFFADFNLDKESRRKLIESGYEQTIKYFKEFLPKKKEKLNDVYAQLLKCLKKLNGGVKLNDVEEVQWWFGDIFTLMCENKEIIDEIIYNKIVDLKNNVNKSVKHIFILGERFENRNDLQTQTKNIIDMLDERITEIRLYLQKINS